MAAPTPSTDAYAQLFTQVNNPGIASANNTAADKERLDPAYAGYHGENSQTNPMGDASSVGGITFAERFSDYEKPWLGTTMRWGTSVEGDSTGTFSGGTPTTALERLDYLETLYGAQYRCMRVFRSWDEGTLNTAANRTFAERGLWISVKARNQNSTLVRYDDIVAGVYDADIDARADEIKALHLAAPLPYLIFTWQHEPEGEQSSVNWAATPYGTQAAAYKAAYEYVRTRFTARLFSNEGGKAFDAPFAFGPIFYAISFNNGSADTYWPGDDICDFAGADAYNWYPAPGEGPWRELQNAASAGGLATFAKSHNVYACLGEVGCFEAPPATYDPDATSGPATRWDSTTFSVPSGPPYDRYPADASLVDREATTPGQRSKAGYIDRARAWLKTQTFASGDKAGDYVFQVLCWYDNTGNYNRFSNTHPNTIDAYTDLLQDPEFAGVTPAGGTRVAWCTDYRNSTHVSQAGTTHPNFGEAGDLEANAPLAMATFWAGNRGTGATGGMTLDAAMASGGAGTVVTIDIVPPASRPSGAHIPTYYPICYGHFLDKPDNTWSKNTSRVQPATSRTITSTSTNKYVPWVRIGNEILGLTAEPTIVGGRIRLSVRRGMWGTSAAAHGVGDRVYSPVFIGRSSGIAATDDQYSGIPTKESVYQLRYSTKIWQSDAQAWIIDQADREAGAADWGGVPVMHCDICSPVQYNIADAWGNAVTQWYDPTNTLMTTQRFAESQLAKVQGFRALKPTKQFHLNNYEPQDISLGYVQDLLAEADAVTLENWLAKYQTAGNKAQDWDGPLQLMLTAAANDWGVLAWPRWDYGESTWSSDAQHKRFSYGTYLLAYRPTLRRFAFGAGWGTGSGSKLNLPEDLFFFDLGDPLANYTSVSTIPQPTTGALYRRDFENGIVLVNPTTTARNFTLPAGTWYRVGHNATLDQIQLVSGTISVGAKDAAILMRDEPVENEARSLNVSWVELRAPNAARSMRVSFVELEVPEVPDRGLNVSFVEFVTPDVGVPVRAAHVSWVELEVPTKPDRVLWVSHVEFEAPSRFGTQLHVSWVQFQVPPRRRRRVKIPSGGTVVLVGRLGSKFRLIVRGRDR